MVCFYLILKIVVEENRVEFGFLLVSNTFHLHMMVRYDTNQESERERETENGVLSIKIPIAMISTVAQFFKQVTI